jgi:hypothetical protein
MVTDADDGHVLATVAINGEEMRGLWWQSLMSSGGKATVQLRRIP